jgi:AT-binding transcription factor 1
MANNNDSKASMEQQQQQPGNQGLSCPLCQNRFADRAQVEQHAATVHNVNAEGLERLMLLVEQANWLNANHATTTATTTTAATTAAATTAAATTATAAATR